MGSIKDIVRMLADPDIMYSIARERYGDYLYYERHDE